MYNINYRIVNYSLLKLFFKNQQLINYQKTYKLKNEAVGIVK